MVIQQNYLKNMKLLRYCFINKKFSFVKLVVVKSYDIFKKKKQERLYSVPLNIQTVQHPHKPQQIHSANFI